MYTYIFKHFYRFELQKMQKIINSIFPQFNFIAKYIIFLNYFFKICSPIIFLYIYSKYNEYIIGLIKDHSLGINMIGTLLIIYQVYLFSDIKIQNTFVKVFNKRIAYITELIESKVSILSIFAIIVILLTINNLKQFLLVIFLNLLFGSLILILKSKKNTIIIFYIIGMLLAVLISTMNTISFWEFTIMISIILFMLTDMKSYLFKYKDIIGEELQKKQTYAFYHIMSIILIFILSSFHFIEQYISYIILSFNFITLSLNRHRTTNVFSLERMGYFNFYIRTFPNVFKKIILKNSIKNNIKLSLFNSLPYLLILLILDKHLMIVILIVLTIFELILNQLIIISYPKILNLERINKLSLYSLNGIVSSNIITLPIMLIVLNIVIDFNPKADIIIAFLIILIVLSIYLSVAYYIWSRKFFENIEVDDSFESH